MAYNMLQQAAFKRTEHLVVEAGVDTEGTLVIELPKELLDILQSVVGVGVEVVGEDDRDGQGMGMDPLAWLLAWLVTFDLFTDAVRVFSFAFEIWVKLIGYLLCSR